MMPSSVAPVCASHFLACASLGVAGDRRMLPPLPKILRRELLQSLPPLAERFRDERASVLASEEIEDDEDRRSLGRETLHPRGRGMNALQQRIEGKSTALRHGNLAIEHEPLGLELGQRRRHFREVARQRLHGLRLKLDARCHRETRDSESHPTSVHTAIPRPPECASTDNASIGGSGGANFERHTKVIAGNGRFALHRGWHARRHARMRNNETSIMSTSRANIYEAKDWFKVLQTTARSQTAVMTLGPGRATGDAAEAHEASDQVLLLVEGELAAEIEGVWSRMKAGDVVVIPPGTKHKFTNPGDVPAVTFSVYSPPEYPPDEGADSLSRQTEPR